MASEEGPLRRFLRTRPRLFQHGFQLVFARGELARQHPREVGEFRSRWRARGASDRLIEKAVLFAEDTVTGQAGFVIPSSVNSGLRDQVRRENFTRAMRPGGMADAWIEGIITAFAG